MALDGYVPGVLRNVTWIVPKAKGLFLMSSISDEGESFCVEHRELFTGDAFAKGLLMYSR